MVEEQQRVEVAAAPEEAHAAPSPVTYLQHPRRAVLEASHLMHQSLRAASTVLLTLMTASAAIWEMIYRYYELRSPYITAMILTVSLACILRMMGETRSSFWVFSVGGVLVEILGTHMAATRTVEELTTILLLLKSSPFTISCIAMTCFLGGIVYGWQSLQRAIQLPLGSLWLLCAGLRYATVYWRCGEPHGVLAITVIYPCCSSSAIMGYFVAFIVNDFMGVPCMEIARRLEKADDQRFKSHRSVAGLLANVSALRSLLEKLPESVRLQYASACTAPDMYGAMSATSGATVQKHPAAGCCVVCFERPFTHAFVPCMHRCVCKECALEMDAANLHACPLCRRPSTSCAQVFDA